MFRRRLIRERISLSESRQHTIKKAMRSDLVAKRSFDFNTFMKIVESLLKEKYGAAPTHSAKEIECLAKEFPDNIKLFAAFREQEMLAGTVIYETPLVAHAQYMAATAAGREVSALDLIVDYLVNEHFVQKRYFDFGTSMEPGEQRLNNGLITYKESFGARTTLYDFYEINLQ